jgi:hypothetical protein
MKQIYSVFTYYQLITAIQIKNKLFPEADADIVISDHSAGYEKAAEKVRESGIFDNVYTAKSVDAMRLDSFSKKLRRVVDIVFYNNKFVSYKDHTFIFPAYLIFLFDDSIV